VWVLHNSSTRSQTTTLSMQKRPMNQQGTPINSSCYLLCPVLCSQTAAVVEAVLLSTGVASAMALRALQSTRPLRPAVTVWPRPFLRRRSIRYLYYLLSCCHCKASV
jgi:hypothetical protein